MRIKQSHEEPELTRLTLSLTYSSVMGLPIKGEHYNLVSMAFYLGFMIFGAYCDLFPAPLLIYVSTSEIPMSSLSQKFPLSKL